MQKSVPPVLGLDSFSCPHCGAHAHQFWHKLFIEKYEKKATPRTLQPGDFDREKVENMADEEDRVPLLNFIDRLEKNLVTFFTNKHSCYSKLEMANLHLSEAHHRVVGLLGNKTLRPVPNTVPSYEGGNIAFAMLTPDGKPIVCEVRREVFEAARQDGCAHDSTMYFNSNKQSFYDAASTKFELREYDLQRTHAISLGLADVIPRGLKD